MYGTAKDPRQPKQSWGKRTKLAVSPDFKLYYKATVIKTAWYWHKNWQRPTEQWAQNQTPALTINIWQGEKSIQWGKDSLFNRWLLEKLNKHWAMKLGSYLILLLENNWEWIKDFNVRLDTINLEKKMGDEALYHWSSQCLGYDPKSTNKAKLNKKWKIKLQNGRKFLLII